MKLKLMLAALIALASPAWAVPVAGPAALDVALKAAKGGERLDLAPATMGRSTSTSAPSLHR
jgi:hypothetical protein